MRRRIAVAPNDNFDAKSSRFKGLAIVRVQTSSSQIIEYAIVCIPPPLLPIINRLRNKITMTPPMLSGIQVPCLLPVDPPPTINFSYNFNSPHNCSSLYAINSPSKYNSPLPPSTIKLSPYIIPPPLQLSTLPPSNEIQLLPSSIVSSTLPLLNDPLPLPTMLIKFLQIPLPPYSPMFPLMFPLPHITRHRMSESIDLEAQRFPSPLDCAQSICR